MVVIGSGKPWHVAAFRDEVGLDVTVLVDRDLESYAAAGLHRGRWRTLGPAALVRALRAFWAGFRQSRLQGDPWQQGGTLILDGDGRVLRHHVSRGTGDALDTRAVLDAVGGQLVS